MRRPKNKACEGQSIEDKLSSIDLNEDMKSSSANEAKCRSEEKKNCVSADEAKSTSAEEVNSTSAGESKSVPVEETKSTPTDEAKSKPIDEAKSTHSKHANWNKQRYISGRNLEIIMDCYYLIFFLHYLPTESIISVLKF